MHPFQVSQTADATLSQAGQSVSDTGLGWLPSMTLIFTRLSPTTFFR